MAFVRKFVILAVLAGFVGAPALRAAAEEDNQDYSERTPASAKKKKKKTAKAGKKGKKHAAKAKHKGSHSGKAKSHAPRSSMAPMPAAPRYPTQPGAGIPEEKRDDLPPPSTPKD